MKKLFYLILLLPVFILIGCSQDSYISPDPISPVEPQEPSATTKPPQETPSPTPDSIPTPDVTPEPIPDPTPEPQPVFGFIDGHADTISKALTLNDGQQNIYNNQMLDVDFRRLVEFGAPVQVFVAWCSNRYVPTAFDQTNLMFDFFESEVAKHSDLIEIAYDLTDIIRIAREGKVSAILAIEGGEALMGKIENLDHFYNRGVRILGLTWNRENELGFGQATNSKKGLKPFGIECIKRMDELGMIMDVSHLNEAGFWDAHNTGTRPYIASHSNTYAVVQNPRNLKDEQIQAIVNSGGIIGFNMYKPFVSVNKTATINDIMAHFKHWIDIGAGNNIGLGCDFDGIDEMPEKITDVSSLKMFKDELTREFDEETSFKIMEGNFYDFFLRYFEG